MSTDREALKKADQLEVVLQFNSDEEGLAFDKAMMSADITGRFWKKAKIRIANRHPPVEAALGYVHENEDPQEGS